MTEPKKKKMPTRADTGAMRESIGTKVDTTLVPYELILAAAVGLNYGEKKYVARNFEKGLSERDLLMSIERHTKALMNKEPIDEASHLPHHVLLASSVAMYVALYARETIVPDLPSPPISKFSVGTQALRYMAVQDLMRDPNE